MLAKAPLCFSGVLESQFYPFLDRATDKTSQKILIAYLPSEFIAQNSDNSMRDEWRGHRRMHVQDAEYGDRFETYGIGPLIALTQLYFDEEAGQSHLRALILSGIATQTLKVSVQRARPSSENQRSFPSGHTSSAFATATALSYAYGAKIAMIAYPLAAFVGASRLADDKHWFSDVVSGAFLGVWIGRASYFQSSEGAPVADKNEFFFFPSISSQSFALNFDFKF